MPSKSKLERRSLEDRRKYSNFDQGWLFPPSSISADGYLYLFGQCIYIFNKIYKMNINKFLTYGGPESPCPLYFSSDALHRPACGSPPRDWQSALDWADAEFEPGTTVWCATNEWPHLLTWIYLPESSSPNLPSFVESENKLLMKNVRDETPKHASTVFASRGPCLRGRISACWTVSESRWSLAWSGAVSSCCCGRWRCRPYSAAPPG